MAPESRKVRRGFARDDLFCRRARNLPDRHGRLRRHPAAGDDAARADPTSTVRTGISTRWPTIRRSRRWAKRCPTPRCSGAWPRTWASPSRAFATATTTWRGRRGDATIRARARSRLGRAEARRLAAPRRARGLRAVRAKATFRRRRANANSGARRTRALGPGSAARLHSRRANRRRPNPELARRYPLAFISPPARNFLNSSFANLPRVRRRGKHAEARSQSAPMPPRAASRMATIVRIRNDRGSFTATRRVGRHARVRAWRWRRRSGGRSWRPTAATPTP